MFPVLSPILSFVLCFRPLAGCGLFPRRLHGCDAEICFRPLAGCGLFPSRVLCSRWVIVSVPLRGVGCFLCMSRSATCGTVSVPLRGVGCFGMKCPTMKNASRSFRPLAGCGLFPAHRQTGSRTQVFPSPCGVWVVSAKLHILSGATGKRIVNSAILLYHIGRCLSIAN